MPCPSTVQNDFGPSKSFWLSTNPFEWIQFILFGLKSFWTGPNYKNLNLTKMIWTRPKQFGPDQNNLDGSKLILDL